jgi:HAD superfamily hydrolase (TIGR01509 family)
VNGRQSRDGRGVPKAVLLDVGGTLWPDHHTLGDEQDDRLNRLKALLPGVEPARVLTIFDTWLRRATEPLEHDVDSAVRSALLELGLVPTSVPAADVLQALCVPAAGRVPLFPGTRELLVALREWRLACVVLSNTMVRSAAAYWQDFRDFGLADLLDGVVTSMDVGFRKPHPAMFQAAVEAAGSQPGDCVMVGNSEVNDVLPAARLGMRTIRVAIEEPAPADSAAHAIATSLDEVQTILRTWVDEPFCR